MKHRILSDKRIERVIKECQLYTGNARPAIDKAFRMIHDEAANAGVMRWTKEKQSKEAFLAEIGVVFLQASQEVIDK